MSKTIALSKPLATHKGDVSEIVLRDPVGSDFITINKLPLSFASDGTMQQTTPDFVVAVQWAARLSGIDAMLLGTLNRKDFAAMVNGLLEHLNSEADEPGNSPA